jgi:hypothetical protein
MSDSEKRLGRGGRNPHMTTTQKKPCDKCGLKVDHYPDGTISAHKIYEFKEINGVMKKTTKWSYCTNKRWG